MTPVMSLVEAIACLSIKQALEDVRVAKLARKQRSSLSGHRTRSQTKKSGKSREEHPESSSSSQEEARTVERTVRDAEDERKVTGERVCADCDREFKGRGSSSRNITRTGDQGAKV
ncbi:TPA_asm: X protein [little skate bornavirus]|uniref:X protein n=1 Tax=little skate bornavirus TaxID=3055759 RepID=A0AA48P917_9MONO|nr:TPA_asm: X protein [little skate bornavirus]